MSKKCHVCYTDSNFLLTKDDFDLYVCPSCKLVFVHPQPAPDFLAQKYYSFESGYMSNRARQDLSQDKEQDRVKYVFDTFQKYKKNGLMLDVGCGNGQMLYWAQKRGIAGKGVEINKRTADRAKEYGFDVWNGFLETAPFEKHSFDFVFLGEIIEHVNDPRTFIDQSSAFLKSDGMIGITTPNIDCPWSKTNFILYKMFGIPWSSVTPPYHLFQFNPDNLDRLMKDMGFDFVGGHFFRIPPLKYELGMLHLLKRYKKTRSLKDFVYMLFAYGVYTVNHTIFRILHYVFKKDFQMVRVYKKT
jgi:2-polyprenyl-3-methyl-5-hydroxy-6-metoxy-1,4-benzoquinol methylase